MVFSKFFLRPHVGDKYVQVWYTYKFVLFLATVPGSSLRNFIKRTSRIYRTYYLVFFFYGFSFDNLRIIESRDLENVREGAKNISFVQDNNTNN